MQTTFVNNDQGSQAQNVAISGLFPYATGDYGSSWATTAAIAAALLKLYPVPQNGDSAVLRNTNGTDETRKYTYVAGAWEADAVTAIADGAVVVAKLANDAVETAKIKDANVTAAKLATDAVETAKIKNANVTPAKLSTAAGTRIFSYQVEDLAANADITARAIFVAPTGVDVTLVSAAIIPHGSAAGVDDANTCVVALTDGTNTIVTKTYNTGTAMPAANAVGDLGSLSATYKVLSAGEKLHLVVTTGTTANPPAFMLQVVYTVADA